MYVPRIKSVRLVYIEPAIKEVTRQLDNSTIAISSDVHGDMICTVKNSFVHGHYAPLRSKLSESTQYTMIMVVYVHLENV
jgi:hypothetical protein